MLQELLARYGYVAIFVGTFLEGETILLMAGFAAHRGYLSLPWSLAAAWGGSVAGDQLYFWIGREWGGRWLRRRPAWQARVERIDRILVRYPALFVLGFRFVYGIRTVSPFAIGMSRTPAWKFVLLNLAGGAMWASLVGGAGYVFGGALEQVFGRAKRYELLFFVVACAVGACVGLVHLRHERRAIRCRPRRP